MQFGQTEQHTLATGRRAAPYMFVHLRPFVLISMSVLRKSRPQMNANRCEWVTWMVVFGLLNPLGLVPTALSRTAIKSLIMNKLRAI